MGSAQMEGYHAKWVVREAPNLEFLPATNSYM